MCELYLIEEGKAQCYQNSSCGESICFTGQVIKIDIQSNDVIRVYMYLFYFTGVSVEPKGIR